MTKLKPHIAPAATAAHFAKLKAGDPAAIWWKIKNLIDDFDHCDKLRMVDTGELFFRFSLSANGCTTTQDVDSPYDPGEIVGLQETFIPCYGVGLNCTPASAGYVCFRDGAQKFKNDGSLHNWPLSDPPRWKEQEHKFKHARSMPTWAIRSFLRIESVSVKRVQEVSEEEALAMGYNVPRCAEVFERASKGVKWAYERCHIDDRGRYSDFDFCPTCAVKCAKPGPWKDIYGQMHETKPGIEIDGWDESHESDINKRCDHCGVLLHHSLTKYGVDRELCFEDGPQPECYATKGSDAAILANLAGGIGDMREEHHGRLAQFGFATDNAKTWTANPFVGVALGVVEHNNQSKGST